MTTLSARWTEPVCILVAVFVVAKAQSVLPDRIELGSLAAGLGLALLLQGFVRDIFTLRRLGRTRIEERPAVEERACICLESALGLPVILAGLALTVVGIDQALEFRPPLPACLAAAVWSLGWAVRDLVVEWSPFRIVRVKDHGSILVRWRAK